MRPDRHGIIANTMEDVGKADVTFTMANSDPFWWSQSEPLWVTAEKADVRTATLFWPGSNVDFGGVRARDWWMYAKENSEAQRVDAVIDWLRRPTETRPQFVTLYFDTVDTAGHECGPEGVETNKAIADVDAQIGRLVDGVATLGLRANYVILADHGMAATSPDRVIPLWKVANAKDYRVVTAGAVAGLVPQPGRERRLARALLKPHPHMTCARKADLPPALHYGQNPRVPPFLCIAEVGWYIHGSPPPADKPFKGGGAHGYDPANREMDALFIANGPAFRPGVTLPVFDNIDIYSLVAGLIGVSPRSSDGSAAVFAPALTARPPSGQ